MGAPSYLTSEEIIELNRKVTARIGGVHGLRDAGALESSVAQPQTGVFGQERYATIFEKAAAYCFYIVRLHPFLDGNKRTGLLAALTFFLDHGVTPHLDQDETYNAIHDVATGKEQEVDRFAVIFRASATAGPNDAQ